MFLQYAISNTYSFLRCHFQSSNYNFISSKSTATVIVYATSLHVIQKILLIDLEQYNVILYNSIVILYMFNGIILQSIIEIEKIWMISRTAQK